MESFSVRCVFRWYSQPDQKAKSVYEERITLWQANNIDQAIEFAEQEALTYASIEMEFVGFSQAYALFNPIPVNGVEVFSLIRESDLEPKEYIGAFFDTGLEHENKA